MCLFFFSPSLFCFSFISLFLLCDPPFGVRAMHACGALYTAWKCRGFHFSFICVDAVFVVVVAVATVVIVAVVCVFHAGGQLRSGLSVFHGIAFGYIEKFEC